ncbi:cytochrome c oxidase assembly protein [Micromonospora sp. NPDC051296]|uniref:cytochrome c oxidase assembly protein n=1 Tax=Micromonospora sp. NPDC051296 TaxID=3155046 RepID=UPI00341D25CE
MLHVDPISLATSAAPQLTAGATSTAATSAAVEVTAGAVPLAAEATPPPFSVTAVFTEARLDSWLAVGLVLAAGLYLYGVHRLRVRGDRWPVARTIFFLGPGLGGIASVTVSGLHAYDTALLSVHMVQHMALSMVSPIFLALGAPVTLALRTLPTGPRKRLLAVVHSRIARIYTFPLVAFAIFVVNPFALYFTDLYRYTLEHAWAHELVHAHFIMTGCVFFWPLLGLDPLPGRWPYPGRALLMLLSVPFHTVLGLTIMQSTTLFGGDWYPSLGLSWADPWEDQVLAGGILWAGGEFVSVTMLAVLVVQWMRHAEREARRIDRELDRQEARQRAAEAAG